MPNTPSASSLSALRQELQRCYVLHQRPFKESAMILDVFSEHHGRLSMLAKGDNQDPSRLKGLLQPFSPLFLSWTGQADLKILADAQPDGGSNALQGPSLFAGLYINELLTKALHRQDPYRALYGYYADILLSLQSEINSIKISETIRQFEYQLLSELGYALDSKTDPYMTIRSILGGKPIHSRVLVQKLLSGVT